MRIHRIGQKRTVTVRRFIVKVSMFSFGVPSCSWMKLEKFHLKL